MILQRGPCRQSRHSIPRKSRPSPVSQHLSHHSHYRNTATAAENCRGNSGEPKRIWAPLDQLPANTWPYTAAGLAQYRAGSPFSLHGFTPEPVAV
jgi:hypothetical protein